MLTILKAIAIDKEEWSTQTKKTSLILPDLCLFMYVCEKKVVQTQ